MADISSDFVLILTAFSVKATLLGFVAWIGILLTSNVNLKNRIAVAALAGMLFLPVCSLLLPPLNLPVLPNTTPVAIHQDNTEQPSALRSQPSSKANPHLNSIQDVLGDFDPKQSEIRLAPTTIDNSAFDNPASDRSASTTDDLSKLASQQSEVVSLDGNSYFASQFNLPVWQNCLFAIYLAGFVLLLGRVMTGLLSISSVIRRSKNIPSLEPKSGSSVRFHESSEIEAPMMFGVRKPTVLLPPTWRQWSQEKLDSILAHELAHVGRKDWLVALMAEINSALFWFHPMAWIVRSYLAKTAEVCCDDTVISDAKGLGVSDHRIRYAKHLLEVASDLSHSRSRIDRSALALTMANASGVETRIDSILNFKRSLASPLGRTRIACVSMGMFALVAFTAVLVASPTKIVTDPIESIGVVEVSTSSMAISETSSLALDNPTVDPAMVNLSPASVAKTPLLSAVQETNRNRLAYKGQVLDSDGAPVKDAKIYLVPVLLSSEKSRLHQLAPPPKPICLTNESGMFSFEKKIHDSDLNYSQFMALWEVESIVAVTQDRGFVNADALAFETTNNWRGRTSNSGVEKRVNKSRVKLNSVLRIPKPGKPITGAVVDLNGNPIEGASIKMVATTDMRNDSLDSFYSRNSRKMFQSIRIDTLSEYQNTKTDMAGGFSLNGIADGRTVSLQIGSPSHVTQIVKVQTIQPTNYQTQHDDTLYATGFTVVLRDSKEVRGIVRHAKTGNPLAGILVHSRTRGSDNQQVGNSLSFDLTNDQGEFTLQGLPIAANNSVYLVPGKDALFIKKNTTIDTTSPTKIDISLEPGSLLKINASNALSHKGIRGTAVFLPKNGIAVGARTTENGSTEFVAPTTEGYVTFKPWGKLAGDYPYADLPEEVTSLPSFPKQVHFFKKVDLTKEQEIVDVDIELVSRESVQLTPINPAGQPLDGKDHELIAFGLHEEANFDPDSPIQYEHASRWETFDGQIRGEIEKPRLIVVVDQTNKLVGSLEVDEQPDKPIMLPMKPWGVVKGTILDSTGQPIPNAKISVNTTSKMILQLKNGAKIGRKVKLVGFPYPNSKRPGIHHDLFDLKTNEKGQFQLHGFVPNQKYRITVESLPVKSVTVNIPGRGGPELMHQRNSLKVFDSTIEAGHEVDLGEIKIGKDEAVAGDPVTKKW